MKSIEEKAKRYDEAIKRIENIKTGKCEITFMFTEGLFEYLFPELKESEDERIRKELIKMVNYFYGSSLNCQHSVSQEDILAWLEKQGKQQDVNIQINPSEYINDMGGNGCYLKNTIQKPTDKIEPKFKVGDWVIGRVTNNEPRQISEITDQYYKSTYGGQYGFSFEDEMRLWTIQDAKEGDVLSYRNGQWIFILKRRIDKDSFEYYTLWSTIHNHLTINDSAFSLLINSIYPATKEQRDTLMKAMADAGYKFDFEKKELKKIEQKPTWSEEDKKIWEEISDMLWEGYKQSCSKFTWNNIRDWIKPKIEYFKDRAQPKQEWSKEDENMFGYALDMIEWYGGKNENKTRIVNDWLKSLKKDTLGSRVMSRCKHYQMLVILLDHLRKVIRCYGVCIMI